MKKLYSLLFILFLLPHVTVNAESVAEKLEDLLDDVSSNKLDQEQSERRKLSTAHSSQILHSVTTGPYHSALTDLKNKGVVRAVKPSDNTRIDQWTYLCTHNAFSSKAHKYHAYRQQDLSMTEQLNRGVRALMLDAWPGKNVIFLTHGDPGYDLLLRSNPLAPFGYTGPMRLDNELKTLKENFFDKGENKGEVVFIILEDYIDDRDLMDKTWKDSGLASKILQPKEWDPVAQNGWPTFKWMKDKGKQIVIFSDKGATEYIYPQWQNMYENKYGKIDNVGVSEQRSSSTKYNTNKRYFYMFNFFKDYAESAFANVDDVKSGIEGVFKFLDKLDFKSINSTQLLNALNYSFNSGPTLIKGRYPNFIALDFFEQGAGFKTIDDINEKTSKNPAYYYRPIQ